MEADAELRAFLSRDEDRAPAGFVARVLRACRENHTWDADHNVIENPIRTVEQLRAEFLPRGWLIGGSVGEKSCEHLRYLFETLDRPDAKRTMNKSERDNAVDTLVTTSINVATDFLLGNAIIEIRRIEDITEIRIYRSAKDDGDGSH